jgi:2-aminoethylphosphonate-pyruvate transaminase
MILLTPGPCMTSESVRQAAALPDMNHRDPAFTQLVTEVRHRLLTLYSDTADWTPHLIGGSGTAAVEGMVTSCIKSGPCLILENGYYSERVGEIFEIHQLPHKRLRWDWLSAWDFKAIEEELASGNYEAVLGTHNETTTGRLNDIARLGRLCRQYGTLCLIDAMSSFGADQISFEGIDAVASSANKCLHGIPGISFVLASPHLVQRMHHVPRRTYYLSLPLYAGPEPPLTPPVPATAALLQALREHPGLQARQQRYLSLRTRIRRELPYEPLLAQDETSCTMTVFETKDAPDLIERLRQHGLLLYGCKGALRETCFQVANMGEVEDQHVDALLAALADGQG